MDSVAYLDTHLVVWLYVQGDRAPITADVRKLLQEADDLRFSPMVRLELEYLFEIERIGADSSAILDELNNSIGLQECDAPFAAVVAAGLEQKWTRDPFDRLIVAQAAIREAPLLTKDEAIRRHYARAVW